MNTGFGFWLFGMSLGANALGGMLGMANALFIVPVLALFGGVDLARGPDSPKKLSFAQVRPPRLG